MSNTTAPLSFFEETLRRVVRDVLREELPAILRAELASTPCPAPAAEVEADSYVTAREAALIASVSEKTVRRWLDTGRLRSAQVGRIVRIRRADLEGFLASGGGRSRSRLSADEVALAVLQRRRT